MPIRLSDGGQDTLIRMGVDPNIFERAQIGVSGRLPLARRQDTFSNLSDSLVGQLDRREAGAPPSERGAWTSTGTASTSQKGTMAIKGKGAVRLPGSVGLRSRPKSLLQASHYRSG